MPSYKSTISFRIGVDVLARVDELAEHYKIPYTKKTSRSQMLQTLIAMGLEAYDREQSAGEEVDNG